VFVWWLLRSEPQADAKQGGSVTTALPSTAVSLPPLTAQQRQQQEQTNPEKLAGFKASFATPINLYGKVLDQHGDPVTSADIQYSVLGLTGKQKKQITSKPDGSFEITGHHGGTLGVEVSKSGYRKMPGADDKVGSGKLFYFGLGHPPVSSPEAPVVFTLQKPGVIEPLIHAEERNYRLPRDGSPTEIDLHQGGNNSHRVVLRCWNKELEPRSQTEPQYDWRLEIAVPDGGITERKDNMAFEAPSVGYEPKASIEMPVNAKPHWSASAERSYFIRFEDNTFARVALRMRARGDHFIVWESHLNPKPGSRNLEADPSQH